MAASSSGDGRKLTRRTTLAAAGAVAVGAGLGTTLEARQARAADGDAKLLLKLHKKVDGRPTLITTIELPPELVDKLEASGDKPIQVVFEYKKGKHRKVLGQRELTGAHRVREAIKSARRTAPRG